MNILREFAGQPIRTRASKADIFALMLRWSAFPTASIVVYSRNSKLHDYDVHYTWRVYSGAESTLKVGAYFNIFPIFLPISESGGCNKKPTN